MNMTISYLLEALDTDQGGTLSAIRAFDHRGFIGEVARQILLEADSCKDQLDPLFNLRYRDLDRLVNRGFRLPGGEKPRIRVSADMTSKGNLAVEWEPASDESGESDFVWFSAEAAIAQRPPNRLILIHDYSSIVRIAEEEKGGGRWTTPDTRIDAARYVVFAIDSLIDDVVRFLKEHFDVVSVVRPFVITQPDGMGIRAENYSRVIVRDEQELADERKREKDLHYLERKCAEFGFEAIDFVKMYESCGRKVADVVRECRKQRVRISDSQVRTLIKRIRERHPNIWEDAHDEPDNYS